MEKWEKRRRGKECHEKKSGKETCTKSERQSKKIKRE